jgi:hypothetical protein
MERKNFEIVDISLQNYFNLSVMSPERDVYDGWAELMDANCNYKQKLLTLTFDEVEVLKKIVTSGGDDVYSRFWEMWRAEELNYNDVGFLEFMNEWKCALKILELVSKMEEDLKPREFSSRIAAAGNDEFEKLGSQAVKIRLGKEFGQVPKTIGQWAWIDVYNVLLYNRIEYDVRMRLNKIK